jgi:hypothetical protein
MKITRLAFVLSMIGLVSCATMNEDQCRTANWQEIGRKDGLRGLSSSMISNHSKACEKHGISANQEQYKLGYDEGVKVFCTPESGFEAGRSGRAASADCPSDMQAGFQAAWQKGHAEYAREMAAQQQAKRDKENADKTAAFFDHESTGGICDASANIGVCFVFSGADYANKDKNRENLSACRLFGGRYRPIGSCSKERVLGKCSIVKGTPQEYHLFYYALRTVDLNSATRDCANPKSSIHRHGAGIWTPYPI